MPPGHETPRKFADSEGHIRYCSATSKRTGKPCRAYAMTGSNVCYHHGGRTPKGIASPHYKNGAHIRRVPERMIHTVQEAMHDPEILNLTRDLAHIEGRIDDLMKRVDSGEAGSVWNSLRSAHEAFLEAQATKDTHAARRALNSIDRLIARGQSDYAAWHEVTSLIEQRRRLVESERKRRVEMENYITAQQGLLLVGALLDIIRKRVDDRGTLAAIQRDVNALVATNAGDGAG